MEKPVRLDLEYPTAFAFDPCRVKDDAAMVIIDWRRMGNGERPELVDGRECDFGARAQRRPRADDVAESCLRFLHQLLLVV